MVSGSGDVWDRCCVPLPVLYALLKKYGVGVTYHGKSVAEWLDFGAEIKWWGRHEDGIVLCDAQLIGGYCYPRDEGRVWVYLSTPYGDLSLVKILNLMDPRVREAFLKELNERLVCGNFCYD